MIVSLFLPWNSSPFSIMLISLLAINILHDLLRRNFQSWSSRQYRDSFKSSHDPFKFLSVKKTLHQSSRLRLLEVSDACVYRRATPSSRVLRPHVFAMRASSRFLLFPKNTPVGDSFCSRLIPLFSKSRDFFARHTGARDLPRACPFSFVGPHERWLTTARVLFHPARDSPSNPFHPHARPLSCVFIPIHVFFGFHPRVCYFVFKSHFCLQVAPLHYYLSQVSRDP